MSTAYRVYILRNSAGRLYIGITANVTVRLQQHNAGESKWTAKFGPWELHWVSHELSLGDARKLENLLKRQKGGDGFYKIIGMPKVPKTGSQSRGRGIVGSNPTPAPNL